MKELQAIQSKLEAPKGQYNSFGKYNYRSAEDILKAIKPLADEQKATITLSDEIVMLGNRFYIKATAKITNSSGESESAIGFAREAETKKGMDDSQVTGSTSSYARKYALNGLFAIDDTKDSDSNEQATQTRANNNAQQTKGTSNSSSKPKNPLHSEFGKLAKKIESKNNIDEKQVYSIISGQFGLQVNEFMDFIKLSDNQKQTIVTFMQNAAQ
ncbi:ERF family protein [Leuconostoc gasicomitatum]|uniref:ERF family protein n=1 Tax=Leuconostoc gasicomitatum TaxID=115778 RepID=UPI001CC658B2|nr:ERF family protein [Leuconostoc gasicomitatum]MBZ5980064.1 ERF family protein [Leuconostoc gasicomitatum]